MRACMLLAVLHSLPDGLGFADVYCCLCLFDCHAVLPKACSRLEVCITMQLCKSTELWHTSSAAAYSCGWGHSW